MKKLLDRGGGGEYSIKIGLDKLILPKDGRLRPEVKMSKLLRILIISLAITTNGKATSSKCSQELLEVLYSGALNKVKEYLVETKFVSPDIANIAVEQNSEYEKLRQRISSFTRFMLVRKDGMSINGNLFSYYIFKYSTGFKERSSEKLIKRLTDDLSVDDLASAIREIHNKIPEIKEVFIRMGFINKENTFNDGIVIPNRNWVSGDDSSLMLNLLNEIVRYAFEDSDGKDAVFEIIRVAPPTPIYYAIKTKGEIISEISDVVSHLHTLFSSSEATRRQWESASQLVWMAAPPQSTPASTSFSGRQFYSPRRGN